jgi:hypothetical protein
MPWYECGRNLSVKMQHEELYQWGLMVGTPSTPEKGVVANRDMKGFVIYFLD